MVNVRRLYGYNGYFEVVYRKSTMLWGSYMLRISLTLSPPLASREMCYSPTIGGKQYNQADLALETFRYLNLSLFLGKRKP